MEDRQTMTRMVFTKMILELDKRYEDRMGLVWKIIEIRDIGGHPVTAARWEGKGYRTRTYLRDGRFYANYSDLWDLVKEVQNEPAREGS